MFLVYESYEHISQPISYMLYQPTGAQEQNIIKVRVRKKVAPLV